jgi:hypothetical protein
MPESDPKSPKGKAPAQAVPGQPFEHQKYVVLHLQTE